MSTIKLTFITNCVNILQQQRLLHFCFILCILISISNGVNGIRAKRTSPLDGDTSIYTEYIDRNNRTVWAMFNLTEAQVSRIFAGQKTNNKDPAALNRDSEYFRDVKEYRVNDIRSRLETVFHVSNSEESQEHPLHEMAAYPICNSESNESSWLQDNNVTIRFSDSIFESKQDNLNLDSAILRLYKVNPNDTDDHNLSSAEADVDTQKPKRCSDNAMLSPQIRLTVSIVQQLRRNKRERRKRICNTIMISASKTGWVEIDIKRAIYIWENIERQQHAQLPTQQSRQPQPILVGWLMIEVHDEEERPLKPGLYFKPPKCDQADFAIPWNYYRPQTSMPPSSKNEVPRYPRLDVKLIGYASIAPRNYNKDFYDKLRDSVYRQLYNLSKNSAELENESTTSIITPTADNLIESSASTEIQQQQQLHRHHKRHLRRYQHAQNSYNSNNNNDNSNNTSSSKQESDSQQQHHRTVTSEERSNDSSQQHRQEHQQSLIHRRQHSRHQHHHHRHQQLKLQHQQHLQTEQQHQHSDC